MKAIKIFIIILAFYTALEGYRAVIALNIINNMQSSTLEARKARDLETSDVEELRSYLESMEREDLEDQYFDMLIHYLEVPTKEIEILNSLKALYTKISIAIAALLFMVVISASLNKPLFRTRGKHPAEEKGIDK